MGRGFTPTHTLRHTSARCGFSCGRSAHSGSDHHQQPPCLAGSPSPGITQRRWALTSSAVGREPAAGAEAGGRMKGRSNLRRGFIKEERKKVDVKRQGKEEKVKGRLVRVTYHIVYHIQKFHVCLSSRGLE